MNVVKIENSCKGVAKYSKENVATAELIIEDPENASEIIETNIDEEKEDQPKNL